MKNNRYVYMMHMPMFGYYKIGFSNDPIKRFKAIETNIPFKLHLVFTMRDESASSIESSMHCKYSDYRIKGEWFELDNNHALECLFLIAKYNNNAFKIYKNIIGNNIFYADKKWFDYVCDNQEYGEWYKDYAYNVIMEAVNGKK